MATEYFRVEAPYPALASTVLLPQPEMGNNSGLLSQVTVIKMMDGSRRSFVKKAEGKKRHRWDITTGEGKMEELADFWKRYRGSTFKVSWRGETFIGKLGINPVELRGIGGQPARYQVTIELIETQ